MDTRLSQCIMRCWNASANGSGTITQKLWWWRRSWLGRQGLPFTCLFWLWMRVQSLSCRAVGVGPACVSKKLVILCLYVGARMYQMWCYICWCIAVAHRCFALSNFFWGGGQALHAQAWACLLCIVKCEVHQIKSALIYLIVCKASSLWNKPTM